MEKYEVAYMGGESRYDPRKIVDYMIADVPVIDEDGDEQEVQLYAEMENPTLVWDAEREEPCEGYDECATYEDLKSDILRQAEACRKRKKELAVSSFFFIPLTDIAP